jgi:glucokinase
VSSAAPVLAIDIGGTKLAAAVVAADGTVVQRHQVATRPTEAGSGDELWATLSDLTDQVLGGVQPSGVGVGCGGPMTWVAGEVSPLNIPAWRDYPLRSRLAAKYPGASVRLHNDAIAMAVGEHWRGAGRGASAFLGVVVSTGVGGGLVLDGTVLSGDTGNAGHVGHVIVDSNGPACACGGRGCLEAIARGPAVVAWAVSQGWQPATGEADGRSLLTSAQAGDQVAAAAFERAGDALGVALASTAHLLELDRVAIGGGLSNAGEFLLGPARAAFGRHVRMAFASRCEIVPASLGGDAGLVGAAAFIHDAARYWPLSD